MKSKLYLIIVAVCVLGALLFIVERSKNKSVVAQAETETTHIFNAMKAFFARGSTSGIRLEHALSAGFIPESMVSDGQDGQIISLGSGINVIGSDTYFIESRNGFAIEYSAVPKKYCYHFLKSQAATGWTAIGVTKNQDSNEFTAKPTDYYYSVTGGKASGAASSRGRNKLSNSRIRYMCRNNGKLLDMILVWDERLRI